MTAGGDGRAPDAGDPEIGRRVQEAYATRVGVDTAAQHLWSMDREARRLRSRRRRQRLVSAVASLLLLVAGAGAVAGSAAALPGETLYPVKESLERAELSIAFSDAANARAHLRHSRVRLEELERAAEMNPQIVPEIADRFFASLDRAAALGGDSVAAEVAALRTSASLLMDQVARQLDPSIARSLTVARAPQDASTSADGGGPQALSDDGGSVQSVGGGSRADGAGGGGDDASGDEGAEALEPKPETSVAEADQQPEDGDGSEELMEETATVELPPETIEVEPRQPVGSSPETDSSDRHERQEGDSSQQADHGDDRDGGDETSPTTTSPTSSTARADSSPGTSTTQDEADG